MWVKMTSITQWYIRWGLNFPKNALSRPFLGHLGRTRLAIVLRSRGVEINAQYIVYKAFARDFY